MSSGSGRAGTSGKGSEGRSNGSKSARLNIRLDPEHKALIERAAEYSGESVTSFATSTLVRHARHVIQEHDVTTLTNRDRDLFLALLDEPAEPNAALKRAVRRHRDLIERSE